MIPVHAATYVLWGSSVVFDVLFKISYLKLHYRNKIVFLYALFTLSQLNHMKLHITHTHTSLNCFVLLNLQPMRPGEQEKLDEGIIIQQNGSSTIVNIYTFIHVCIEM